jgi:hypothetical protein
MVPGVLDYEHGLGPPVSHVGDGEVRATAEVT